MPQGSLVVMVTTSGAEQDVDGYRIAIIHLGDSTAVATNDTIQFDVPPGAYSAQPGGDIVVGGSAIAIHGVADNCIGTGSAGHAVVADGGVDTLAFTVTCTATTGSLAIRMVANGVALDPDGYQISIDGGVGFGVPIDAPSTAHVLSVGDHSVAISGVVMNCTPEVPGPVTINIEPAEADTLWWAVNCEWPRVAVRRNANDLALVNPDGSNEQIRYAGLSSDQFRHPALSPDRSRWAVDVAQLGGGFPTRLIGITPLDSTAPTTIADSLYESRPRWRPDGGAVLTVRQDSIGGFLRLAVLTLGTGVRNLLTADSLRVTAADWSPAGDQIVFSAFKTGEGERLYVVQPDGSALTRISPDSLLGIGPPRWSPLGTKIAFVQGNTLYTIAPNGSALAAVPITGGTPFPDFTWSPDGTAFLIRYVNSVTGGGGLAWMAAAGGAVTVLPTSGAGVSYHEPDWR